MPQSTKETTPMEAYSYEITLKEALKLYRAQKSYIRKDGRVKVKLANKENSICMGIPPDDWRRPDGVAWFTTAKYINNIPKD